MLHHRQGMFLQMASNPTLPNPDYESILAAIAAESDPVKIAELQAQMVINQPLTIAEAALFDYVYPDYVEDKL